MVASEQDVLAAAYEVKAARDAWQKGADEYSRHLKLARAMEGEVNSLADGIDIAQKKLNELVATLEPSQSKQGREFI